MNRMTMTRCLFFVGVLLMSASSSHAFVPWGQGDGFYMGVGGGYGYGDFRTELSTPEGGSAGGGFTVNPSNSFGSAHVGYGEIFDGRYYVAAEFSLGLWAGGSRSNDVKILPMINQLGVLNESVRRDMPSVVNGQFAAEPKQDFAIYSRVGYLLPEERGLLYALLGWTYGVQTYTFSTEGFSFTSGTRQYNIGATRATDNVGMSAFTYGMGLELPVDEALTMRIQYRYIDFGSNASIVLEQLNDKWAPILSPGVVMNLKGGSGSGNHVMSLTVGYFF